MADERSKQKLAEKLAINFKELYRPKIKIGYNQWCILGFLQGMETAGLDVHMSHLSQAMGLTTAAITGVVDGLERLQLVCRTLKVGDRRVTCVRITPAGCEAWKNWSGMADTVRNILSLEPSTLPSDKSLRDFVNRLNWKNTD